MDDPPKAHKCPCGRDARAPGGCGRCNQPRTRVRGTPESRFCDVPFERMRHRPAYRAGRLVARHSSGGASSTGSEMTA